MTQPRIERQLRVSGVLVLTGLLLEWITLLWSHPTAFLVFLLVGGSLIAAGTVFYLYSLVADTRSAPLPQGNRAP